MMREIYTTEQQRKREKSYRVVEGWSVVSEGSFFPPVGGFEVFYVWYK